MTRRDFLVCMLGITLGVILAFHVVTGLCLSRNYFSWGETFLCKQYDPFK